jgi:hypothetical protein
LRQQFLREQTSADLPDDTAQAARSTTEVARNENGEIDYVTFTFNVAPRVERRGRAR